ncbi:acylphosphatase [archaeon]|nr:acylphosphatase [archaeon]
MQAKVKRYYVVVRGRVQDAGYRKRIESTAELFNIRGFPWNNGDGSVKIICEGLEDSLNRFLEDINIKERLPSGILVESLEKKEISIEFPLPPKFVRLKTEGITDISRKLDIGTDRLKGIEANTGAMAVVLGSINSKLDKLDKLDTLPERIAEAIK